MDILRYQADLRMNIPKSYKISNIPSFRCEGYLIEFVPQILFYSLLIYLICTALASWHVNHEKHPLLYVGLFLLCSQVPLHCSRVAPIMLMLYELTAAVDSFSGHTGFGTLILSQVLTDTSAWTCGTRLLVNGEGFFNILLEQISEAFLGIFPNQIYHSLVIRISCEILQCHQRSTYLRHYWLSIATLHIPERHLGTFVLVDTQLRVIDIIYLIECDYEIHEVMNLLWMGLLTLILYDEPRYPYCGICSHLFWA
jgi:hypothetical protein